MNEQEVLNLFYQTPFNRHFSFRFISRDHHSACVSMDPLPTYLQEKGLIHGGAITSLADTAGVYIFMPDLPEGKSVASIEFKMSFFRPALPELGEIKAVSRLLKRGRKVGFCEVEVLQADRLIAKGSFTYLFFEA